VAGHRISSIVDAPCAGDGVSRLTNTVGRIAEHKITRLDELLPSQYAAAVA